MRRTTCTYHCRGGRFGGCDSHFHSLEAFDAHRFGPYDGERWCEEPADIDGLVPLRPDPRGGITVWTVGAKLERARALASKRDVRAVAVLGDLLFGLGGRLLPL